ncbi:MAG TPA: murein transglycosylase A [Saprospiraceae bacterium]|nr:murein transglycosylase A [Saprospiraceae bacterium]HMP24023.1 murein transglycosylase A [Saprospiraceae bacterium]
MKLRKTWLLLPLGALLACQDTPQSGLSGAAAVVSDSLLVEEDEEAVPAEWIFRSNGKIRNALTFKRLYQRTPLDTVDFPIITTPIVEALDQQLRLLDQPRQRKAHSVGDLVITPEQLEETARILKQWQQTKPLALHEYLQAHQIWGADRQGNVEFTAYFTPIVKVSSKPGPVYRYPIYSRPTEWEGPLPQRQEIEQGGALKGLGLELAYAANKVDIYYMQLQGSGFVEYPDGRQVYFAYNGTNRHPYRSIEKYLMSRSDLDISTYSIDVIRRFLQGKPGLTDTVLFQNPSYTFFTPRKTRPRGAGSVPLSAEISIAVDRRYIPLGSCLLAAFPVYDRKTRQLRHEYRVFVAQDVGGAIRGPGHVDVYMGVGKDARRKASYLKHYGRLWLLLPKPDNYVSISN